MKEQNLIIYGIGDHAKLIHSYFKAETTYNIVAFTVEQQFITSNEIDGIPIIPYAQIETIHPPQHSHIFVAIGPHRLNSIRERIFLSAKSKGYSIVSFVSNQSRLWQDTKVGENCFIDHGTESHPFVKIGNNNVLLSSSIGHHSIIKNHCFISISIIGGNVTIEDNVFIGMGSIIQSGVTIGKGSIIGLGSIIKKDVEPFSVYSVPRTKKREGIDSREIKIF